MHVAKVSGESEAGRDRLHVDHVTGMSFKLEITVKVLNLAGSAQSTCSSFQCLNVH